MFLDNNKGIDTKETFISEALVGDCPAEFARLPIDVVLEGCLDKLGKFNKQHITLTFILKQGLWFTQQESKDLSEKTPSGDYRDWETDRKSTRLNSSHSAKSRMPSSA